MIEFSQVSKTYQDKYALNHISFTLDTGEMAFLTGHSGAGKSTIIRLIHALESPTRGKITMDDRAIHTLKTRQLPAHRRDIGIVLQDPHLIDRLSVFDNIAMPLIISRCDEVEIGKRVRAALDKVGLLNKEKKFPAVLSAGERQRIGIARAIVNRPRVLLADEPTGNLDPELSLSIMRLFQAFNAIGVTILIATHDISLIGQLNHRMITLKEGQIVGGHHA